MGASVNILVYGTLKKAYWNHGLLRDAEYIGEGVVNGYCLYDGGFPVAQPLDGSSLQGELYHIREDDRATVAACDRLEGTPDFYSREQVEVRMLNEDKVVKSNMYVGTVESFTDLKVTGRRPPCRLNENGHHVWEDLR